MGPGLHIVSYPLIRGLINIVAVQQNAAWSAEGWSHPDNPTNLQQAFARCAPSVRALLAQVDSPMKWGLFRHPIAQRWHDGRMVLIGDAAHPTLPFLAQGANLAIEDAWVLARTCMHGNLPLSGALVRYQSLRAPRVRRAIAAANANARAYHLAGPARIAAHTGVRFLNTIAPNFVPNRLSWLYDFDVTR